MTKTDHILKVAEAVYKEAYEELKDNAPFLSTNPYSGLEQPHKTVNCKGKRHRYEEDVQKFGSLIVVRWVCSCGKILNV